MFQKKCRDSFVKLESVAGYKTEQGFSKLMEITLMIELFQSMTVTLNNIDKPLMNYISVHLIY